MPASGEVFITRDSDGHLWLILPRGAGGPKRIDDDTVEQAIAGHGFARIEQQFEGWEALDRERQRRAGLGAPSAEVDVAEFDAIDVERVLGTAERWGREGKTGSARRLCHRLLEAPVLLREPALHGRLVRFLQQLDAVQVSFPTTDPAPSAWEERMSVAA